MALQIKFQCLDEFKTDDSILRNCTLSEENKFWGFGGCVEEGTVRVTVADLLNQGRLVRSG